MEDLVKFLQNLNDDDRKKMEHFVIYSDVASSQTIVYCYKNGVEIEETEYGETIGLKSKRYHELGESVLTKLVELVKAQNKITAHSLRAEWEGLVGNADGMSNFDYWCNYGEWLERRLIVELNKKTK